MRELFIYYRLHSRDASLARLVVRDFQSQLGKEYPELISRLLCRAEETLGVQTWMEIYSTDPVLEPHGVTAELQAAIEARAHPLTAMLTDSRHIEVFVACAS